MRRADRLMKIVHFLRRRRRAVTAQRIAEEFDICKRTVYRDIQDLMDSGVPISGEAGVGYLIDKDYYLPPVTFDTDELEAIGLGISMVKQWTDNQFAEKAVSAFEKVLAVLPAKLQNEMQQITTYSIAVEPVVPWSVSFSALRECIRQQNKVHFTYTDEKLNNSTRTVRPVALIFASPVWMLAAWCEKRKDFRHFRLDRITELQLDEEVFDADNDKDLAAYLIHESACKAQAIHRIDH